MQGGIGLIYFSAESPPPPPPQRYNVCSRQLQSMNCNHGRSLRQGSVLCTCKSYMSYTGRHVTYITCVYVKMANKHFFYKGEKKQTVQPCKQAQKAGLGLFHFSQKKTHTNRMYFLVHYIQLQCILMKHGD